MLGHFRHEVGHYYWDRLVRGGDQLDRFWAVFGDGPAAERAVRRLNAELARIIRDPALKATLWDRQGIDAVGSPPGEVTRTMRAEIDKWRGVASKANLAVD